LKINANTTATIPAISSGVKFRGFIRVALLLNV
jgi:hypothetical protein